MRGKRAYYLLETSKGLCAAVGMPDTPDQLGAAQCPQGHFPTAEHPVPCRSRRVGDPAQDGRSCAGHRLRAGVPAKIRSVEGRSPTAPAQAEQTRAS